MKTITSAVVMVLGLLGTQSVHSEDFGAWIVGTEIDNMTEKKTDYALGHGKNVTMNVICNVLT
jgi:hypothetical protein